MIFFGFLVIYILSRTNVHGPAEDAWLMVLDFSREKATALLHPHHLLYGPLAHYWWKLWELFGASDAYRTIQTLNSLLGAAAVLQVYCLGRDMNMTRWSSAWVAIASGLCFACWWLSSEIEVAPLSMLVSLVLIRYLWNRHDSGISIGSVFAVTLLTLLTVAAHIFNFALALLVCYVLIMPSANVRTCSLKPGLFYAIIFVFLFTAGTFILYTCADLIAGTGKGAINYLIGYFEPGGTPGISLRAPFLFVVGLARSLFGVEVLFSIPSVSATLSSLFPGKDFSDEIFMVRDMNPIAGWTLAIVMVLISVALVIAAISAFRRRRLLPDKDRRSFMFIMVVLVVTALPVILTGPVLLDSTANNEHLLVFWCIFFLLLGYGFNLSGGLKRAWRILPVVLLLSLFMVNGLGAIRVMKDPGNDLVVSSFSPWLDIVEQGDLAIVHLSDRDAAALAYLFDAAVINTMYEQAPTYKFLRDWKEMHDGRIWVQRVETSELTEYPPVSGFRLELLEDSDPIKYFKVLH